DLMVHYLAARQKPSGEWVSFGIARPPIEDSAITRTAMALRAIKTYGWPARAPEFADRVARGRAWLLKAKPNTNYELADLLMGLYYASADESDLRSVAAALLKEQHPDGGWSQTRYLDSDAYATGMALHAFHATGMLK